MKAQKMKPAIMYETEDQSDGYKALKLYLQKVNPKCTSFLQHPKKNNMALDAVWYELLTSLSGPTPGFHRSEQSLVSYYSRRSTSQLHNCCQVLSGAFSLSANNDSEPSETSQQSESFHTKQTATKSLFGECTIQNV